MLPHTRIFLSCSTHYEGRAPSRLTRFQKSWLFRWQFEAGKKFFIRRTVTDVFKH
jgi:hypothetical protein